MKKLMKHAVQTIRIFCFLGLALQVLLGLWYLAMNVDAWRDVVQVILALSSVFLCANTFQEKPRAVFTSLIINTIPFVLQAHVASYIYSVLFSLVVLGLAGYRILRTKRNYKGLRIVRVLLVVALPVIMLMLSITGGDLSRIQSSIGMTAVERFAWPNIEGKYKQWMPEEISTVFTDSELGAVALYPFKVESEWQPQLEAALGVEEAFYVNLQVAQMGIEQCTLLNVQNILLDTVSYASPYMVFDMYLSGTVNSATSFNLQSFREKTPELASKYFWITYRLLGFMLVLAIPCLLYLLHKKQVITLLKCTGLLSVWLLYVGLVLALQGTACFDYKQTLLQICVYYLPIIYFLESAKGNKCHD